MPDPERPPKIRSFVAVDLTEGVRQKVSEILERLQKGARFTGARPAWVQPGNVHLTLKFLGQIDEGQREAVVRALAPIAARHAPHTVRVRGLGVFPSPRAPRVVWIGVKKATPLFRLQEEVDRALVALGFPEEDREWSPHLTLARLKSMRGARALMDVVASHGAWDCGDWPIHECVLYQSTLRPTGSIYTPLARFPLTGAAGAEVVPPSPAPGSDPR